MNTRRKATLVGLGIIAALVAVNVGRVLGQAKDAPASERKVIWDGERVFPKSFGHIEPKDNTFLPQTDEVHQGKVALELAIHTASAQGGNTVARGGFNWHGWYPADSGEDLTPYTHLVFWVKVEKGKKLERLSVGLESSVPRQPSPRVDVTKYSESALDGQWHEVAIPAADLVVEGSKFNPKKAWELTFESRADASQVPYSVYFDDISFERRAPATQPAAGEPAAR